MINQKLKKKNIASYEIQTTNDVSFSVRLFEDIDGNREFEIILSGNGSDNYSEIFSHPFYKNTVLPWVYKEKEIKPTIKYDNNVIDLFTGKCIK